jgi:hypothetical protein
LLEHIREKAQNPGDNEDIYRLTCTGCHNE